MLISPSLRRLVRIAAALLIPLLHPLPLRAGQTDIKAPASSGRFGSKVIALPNGNLVVVDSGYQNNSGAVYLYRPDGVMISKLTGSGTEELTGAGYIEILVLSNGNYVVRSPGWDNGLVKDAGAVTWCSGVTGLNGWISPKNSLVGSRKGDLQIFEGQVVSAGMTALNNGNYVICSPNWDNGGVTDAGAVTWGDGTAGTVGVISPENSLTGSTANDRLGSIESGGGVTALGNGDYVISCPRWDNASVKDAGFAAWCSGVTGRTGAVSAENALVGSTANDRIGGGMETGRGVIALHSGNYVVCSPLWDKEGITDAGAVTWCPGGGGLTGAVTEKNSLTGSTASDRVGVTGTTRLSSGVTALSDGHYVVASPNWDADGSPDAGAVTWCDGFTGSTGSVSAGGSLTGSRSATAGNGGVFALPDGDYVVCTPSWRSYGAVTRISGGKPFSGVISQENSLTGSRWGDAVGGGGVTILSNGNYVVSSPNWANEGYTRAGAVTWCDGKAALKGIVSPDNSLTGSAKDDNVGGGQFPGKGVVALANGNYVVCSPFWDKAGAWNAGAVTWCPGASGRSGPVTAANSLTGSTNGDQVGGGTDDKITGGVTALSNGNYVVSSLYWDNGAVRSAGAVTWGNGSTGITGEVTAANSLVGLKTGDSVGSGGVVTLSGGNYAVLSPEWDNPATGGGNAGAVTLGDGETGTAGLINPGNSVPGAASGWGSTLFFAADATGTRLAVGQPGAGLLSLFTRGAPNKPLIRVEQPKGNRVSATDFGIVSTGGVKAVQFFIKNPSYTPLRLEGITLDHPAFALSAVAAGALGPGESVVLMVTFSPSSSGPQSTVLRITGGDDAERSPYEILLKGTGVAGGPVILKDLTGPAGSGSFGHSVTLLPNGNIVVTDPYFDLPGPVKDAGAVHLFNSGGTLLSTLTGSGPEDFAGIGGVTVLKNGHYVIRSPFWKNGTVKDAGAVTWADGDTGINGAISADNSLVGSSVEDLIGEITSSLQAPELNRPMPGGVTALENGNYVVCSPRWKGGAGAVTWCDGSTGARGILTVESSLTGGSGHRAGSGGVVALSNGNYVVISPGWRDSLEFMYNGAVTWGSGAAGVSGMISEENSLVGTGHKENDFNGVFAGSGEVTALSNGNYIVCSPFWRNGEAGFAGAVTWGSGATGVTGRISPTNSLTGTAAGDYVGQSAPVILQNGNYVITTPRWDRDGVADAGAVTWCSGTSPVTGPVSAANSLTGSSTEDRVGSGGVTALTNGNYVVCSPHWDSGDKTGAGAATWADGAAGIAGPVNAVNSFTGGAGSFAGASATALTDGNYVVCSPGWNNNGLIEAGAVTWGDGATGLRGVISRENSLTGSHENDAVGSHGVTALPGGAFVVCSPYWNNRKGAVTRCGPGGMAGETAGVQNSLVGTGYGDLVGDGGVTLLSNGNYVAASSGWQNPVSGSRGAVTWCAGLTGRTGEVSPDNSLTGTIFAGHREGSVTALHNGNYLIDSTFWNGNAGAVTWGDGFKGSQGEVSAENSLTGSGSVDEGVKRLVTFDTGHYAVLCPSWKSLDLAAVPSSGAVILGTGTRPFPGMINGENSVLGTAPGGGPAMNAAFRAQDRTFVVGRPADNVVSLFRYRSDTGEEVTVEQPGGGRISAGGVCDFGIVPAGKSVSLVFTVENTGSTALIAGGIDGGGPPFSLTSSFPAGTVLSPGEAASFTVTFTPASAGLYSTILRLYGSGPGMEIYSFTLTGASSPFGDNGASPGITSLPGGKIAVSFKALPGAGYLLQHSEDLRSWFTLAQVTAGPEGEIHFTHSYPLFPRAYYRLKIP